jgi:hypothetical protein
MKEFPVDFSSESILVEKLWVGMVSRVSRSVLQDLKRVHQDHTLRQSTIYTELSPVLDEMFISMRGYLLKSMAEETKTMVVITPATWFDHLKHAILGSGKSWQIWLVKTFSPKVNMTIHSQETKTIRVCPHNDSYWSESTQHLRFITWKTEEPCRYCGYRR